MGIWMIVFIITCISAVAMLVGRFVSKIMMKKKMADTKKQVMDDLEKEPEEVEAVQADGQTVEIMRAEDTVSIACVSCGHNIMVSKSNPPPEIECEMCGRRGPLVFD